MGISVVIPLGKGSQHNNLELRLALRSIQQYLTGYDDIYIIGECPKWVKNVIHIPFEDYSRNPPDKNIFLKVLHACNLPCSDPFLFMNDDHYFFSSYNAGTYPTYYCKTLDEMIAIRKTDPYGRRMINTSRLLKSKGLKDLNFDIHYPILFKKQEFIDRVARVDWNIRDGFVVKSLYGNHETNIEETWDCKVRMPTDELKMFSTRPNISVPVYNYLMKRFEKKSIYE